MAQIRFGETCVSMGDLQDPIDGGTDSIYKVYFSGLCKGIYPQNMAVYGTVPPFLDPEDLPLK